jgi:hypothetical protein
MNFRRPFSAALLASLFLALQAQAQSTIKPSMEELIAALQKEASAGVGFDPVAWADGFMAIDEAPQFRGGIIGTKQPETSPAMREIVRRGVEALPTLLAHLDDARPTGLIVGKGFMGRWLAAEYAPREPGKQPAGTTAPYKSPSKGAPSFDTYTVKVGDLCFVAAGQIVNRRLTAVRYQPTLCLVVNSPIEMPALAAAARADWQGLTPAAHEQQLVRDIAESDTSYVPANALRRLLFYYPASGQQMAVKLLERPLYNSSLGWRFATTRLLSTDEPAQWERRLREFRAENGDANAEGVRITLQLIATREPSPFDKPHQRDRAAAALAHLFPESGRASTVSLPDTNCSGQQEIVLATMEFPSREIDEAALAMLPRIQALEQTNPDEEFAQNALVRTVARRLARYATNDPALRARAAKALTAFLESRPKLARKKPPLSEVARIRNDLAGSQPTHSSASGM